MKKSSLLALRVVLLYYGITVFWLIGSGQWLVDFVIDPVWLMRIYTGNCLVVIVGSAVFFYFILRARLRQGEKEAAQWKQAKALAQSEKHFSDTMIESMPGVLYFYNEQRRFLRWNRNMEAVSGHSGEEIARMHPLDFFPESNRQPLEERIAEVFEKGASFVEAPLLAKNGNTTPYFFTGKRVVYKGEACLIGMGIDITERKQAEDLRAESERKYRELVELANSIILRWNREGQVTFLNEFGQRFFGYTAEEIVGRHVIGTIVPSTESGGRDLHELMDKICADPAAFEQNTNENICRNGRRVSIAWTNRIVTDAQGKVVEILSIGTDVTERRQIEARQLRTQRLESIGTLAGGIAHDLNNALSPILMMTGLLRMQYPSETKMIDTVESSARRGADMVRQLLTFAKGVEGERLLIQPQHLFKEMAKIIEGTFPKNVQLQTTCPNNLHSILGDATQLHQVLLNLCVNARDAMPNGGALSLAAENTQVDAAFAKTIADAKPGRYVVWRVTDTGTGIPPEILERIFEPFFSTKGPDKGTGLGLSTVIGIVKSHDGFVQIQSAPGKGSTFSIYLPAANATAPDTSSPTKTGTTFRGHGETILVVDDEANVRQAARAVLTSLNFKVMTAANGVEALVQVAEKRTELRAVITDLQMPNMDGLTFVRVLKSMLPEAGIIVASGSMTEREADEFKALGVSVLIDKPFTQEKLEEALKVVFQK